MQFSEWFVLLSEINGTSYSWWFMVHGDANFEKKILET